MIIPNKLNITYTAATPDGKRFLKNTESNAVTTEILSYSVLKDIRADKTTVRAGENVRNTVTLTNNSTTDIFNNFFKISKSDGAGFVAGSVKVNGIAQPGYDPAAGFALPDLKPGESVIIEFEQKAITPVKTTRLKHFATFNYTVNDPARGSVNYSENTDTVLIEIIGNAVETIVRVYNGSGRRFYSDGLYGHGRQRCNCCDCFNCCSCCNLCNCCCGLYC